MITHQFPSLGIVIRHDTPKEEVERLRAKYPEIRKALERKEKKTKPDENS